MGMSVTERIRRPWLPALRPLAWATLVSNIGLVVTGGAVRLTGSGLGCPTWPRCTGGALTPHGDLNIHSAIEFSNRMLTFVLVVIAVLTVAAAKRSGRSDELRLSIIIILGIPAQAVLGGITVLSDLNPWVVSSHLIVSMAIISLAALMVWRLDHPAPAAGREHRVATLPLLGLATYAVTWLVIYAGTTVTGAGPHAGDANAPRNGLSPGGLSQLHADLVFLLVGLSIGIAFLAWSLGATAPIRRAILTLIGIEVAQGVIGYVQYFTHLPAGLVGVHMLGAACVMATATWVLLAAREA
jgi:cytochrome c oxidase assembly protein subunit 15